MTDHSKDPLGDPFDLLRAHVRAVALLEQPAVDADELVADITGTIDRADRSRGAQVLPLHGFPSARSPRRRRWFVAGSAATIVAVGGAGVAAYVALRPTDPVAGIVCRESADFGAFSVVLPLEGDPIAACANLWKTGDIPDPERGEAKGEVPELVACEGGQGAIEVLPVKEDQTCETFGLRPMQMRSPTGDVVAQLNAAVIELNLDDCLTTEELAAEAKRLLERFALGEWRVRVEASPGDCSLLAVDPASSVLIVRIDVIRTRSSEEIP